MKRLVCALSLLCAACGGPSTPSPNYPNLAGTWKGITNRDLIINGVRGGGINQCGVTFSIRQNGGDLSGSFTSNPISGVTLAPCPQLTSFSGSVTTLNSNHNADADVDFGKMLADSA